MSGDEREQRSAEALAALLTGAGYTCSFQRGDEHGGQFPDFLFTVQIGDQKMRWAIEETTLHAQFGTAQARRPAVSYTRPWEAMIVRLKTVAASVNRVGYVFSVKFPVRSPRPREIEAKARQFIRDGTVGEQQLDDDGNVTIRFDPASTGPGLLGMIMPSLDAPDQAGKLATYDAQLEQALVQALGPKLLRFASPNGYNANVVLLTSEHPMLEPSELRAVIDVGDLNQRFPELRQPVGIVAGIVLVNQRAMFDMTYAAPGVPGTEIVSAGECHVVAVPAKSAGHESASITALAALLDADT
jgi:hypothetical protein